MTIFNVVAPTRREVLAGLGALTAAVAPAICNGRGAGLEKVRGRVLISDVGSARDGAGLANVMVSNGRDVTVTDAAGTWELEEPPPGGDIFIIKPSGFTYREQAGIPCLSPRTARTSPNSLDFQLKPQAEDGVFEVALFADTQAANAQELDYVRREIARSVKRGAFAFAINHGDVMGDDLALFAPYKGIVRDTGMLWHHCPGNHDMDLASTSHARAFDTWKREIGPPYYAFQYAGATFILLNNVEYFGAGAERIDGRLYRGRIGHEQLIFVENVLKNVPKDQLVVVSMHVPLLSFENPKAPGDNTADRTQLMRLLSQFSNTVSFSGHSHTTEHHYLGSNDGFTRSSRHHHHVLTAFCGSWWGGPLNEQGIPISDSRDGSPRGYHVLRVQGNAYQTRFVAVGDKNDAGARLEAKPAGLISAHATEVRLTVDIFDGGPNTRIVCRWPGEVEAFELTRAAIPDPHIVESYARNHALLKPWVIPAPSSHMWTAILPSPAGKECVLDITDEYGREKRLVVPV